MTTTTADSPARDIVFIDSRVQDTATLLQGLQPGTEVVFLQAGQDGLAQMAAALGERGDVGTVQVIAHGSAGQLWLGSSFLDNAALQQPEVQAQLAALGLGLTADGDLLIYACNTAQGSEGAQFVSTLAALTGADVAASDDRTGAGGDWELELSTGSIGADAALSAQGVAQYQHSLATLTVTTGADTGADASFDTSQAADALDGGGLSLREALHWAQSGDTVTFSADMTISLSTKAGGDSLLILNKNLTIDGDWDNDGTADVTLDGQHKGQVLNISSGTTVTLDGLTITNGLLSGNGGNGGTPNGGAGASALGAGIYNAGTLTITHSSLTGNVATGGGGAGGGGARVVGRDLAAVGAVVLRVPAAAMGELVIRRVEQMGALALVGAAAAHATAPRGQQVVTSTHIVTGSSFGSGGMVAPPRGAVRVASVLIHTA